MRVALGPRTESTSVAGGRPGQNAPLEAMVWGVLRRWPFSQGFNATGFCWFSLPLCTPARARVLGCSPQALSLLLTGQRKPSGRLLGPGVTESTRGHCGLEPRLQPCGDAAS